MATVQQLAGQLSAAFTRQTRPDDSRFWALADDAPDWMRDVCQEAHDGMLPDDYRYEMIEAAAESIDRGDEDPHECADAVPSCYHGARYAWLASNNCRAGYVDEAVEELGYPGDLSQAIAYGWYAEATEVWNLVMAALDNLADGDESTPVEG